MTTNKAPKDEGLNRFEKHLQEFRPVAPRAFAIPVRRAPWGALAVAAGVLLVIALSLVLGRSRHSVDTSGLSGPKAVADASISIPVTLGRLNLALRASDQELNQILDNASPRLLPREHRGTALFELGKE